MYERREVEVKMKLLEDLPEIKEDEGQTNPLVLIVGENKKTIPQKFRSKGYVLLLAQFDIELHNFARGLVLNFNLVPNISFNNYRFFIWI